MFGKGIQILGRGKAVPAHGIGHLPADGIHHISGAAYFPHLGNDVGVEPSAERRIGRDGHDGDGPVCTRGLRRTRSRDFFCLVCTGGFLCTRSAPQRSQDPQQRFFVRAHGFRRLLGPAQFGTGHQFHGRSNLQRTFDGADPAFYFLQSGHYFRARITDSAVSVRIFSISGVSLPSPRGSRTSAWLVARRRSR